MPCAACRLQPQRSELGHAGFPLLSPLQNHEGPDIAAATDTTCILNNGIDIQRGIIDVLTRFWVLQGNLSEFVKVKPEAKTYYDLQESQIKFILPEPGFLEGIKSKDRAILKMHRVAYKYAAVFRLRVSSPLSPCPCSVPP